MQVLVQVFQEKCCGPPGLDPGAGASWKGEVPRPGSFSREETLDQATASTLLRAHCCEHNRDPHSGTLSSKKEAD